MRQNKDKNHKITIGWFAAACMQRRTSKNTVTNHPNKSLPPDLSIMLKTTWDC
jgi:hypothetical protein